MGGQIVKRLAMLALLLTLTLATAVTTVNGQGRPTLKANVPFEFVVGDKTLKSRQEGAIERELSRIAANRPSKYDEVVVRSCER